MKRWCAIGWMLLVALWPVIGRANVIVFIDTRAAGPAVPRAIDDHPTWMVWPYRGESAALGPAISVATGFDYRVSETDVAIRGLERHRWRHRNFVELSRRGIAIRDDGTGIGDGMRPLEDAIGAIGREAGVASLRADGADFESVPWNARLERDRLYVFSAHHWDEVRQIEGRDRGRLLVIEWVPDPKARAGHFWLMGKDWPEGTPVSREWGTVGAVALRESVRLIQRPEQFRWTRANPYESPRRWIDHEPMLRAVGFGMLVVLGFVVFVTAVAIGREEGSSLLTRGMDAAMLLPGGVALAGRVSRGLGPESIAVTWLGCWLALIGLTYGVQAVWRARERRRARSESSVAPADGDVVGGAADGESVMGAASIGVGSIGVGSVGGELNAGLPALLSALVVAISNPAYLPFSSVFAEVSRPVSGVWAGVLFSQLVIGFSLLTSAPGAGTWVVRGVAVALFATTLNGALGGWWGRIGLGIAVLPLWALLMAERWFPMLAVLAMAAVATLVPIIRFGFSFDPHALASDYWSVAALNMWWYTDGLRHPAGLVVLLAGVGGALGGQRYYIRQVQRAIRMDARLSPVAWTPLVFLALAIAKPMLLEGLAVVALLTLLALHRAAWTELQGR
ncbi:MAG: hypothetical protein SFX74_12970 [Fimbriimonadaceae bacterium]|nr:hypothetical protein [Fimbriimonadaceae bacterium]